METRLSWVALRNQVALRTGLSQKEVNVLLRTGLDCIIAALQSGDFVRLGELGTFRIQQVAPRKSVDVTTGEAIMLDSYKRVNFTPSETLKNTLNGETDSHLMPGNDPIRKLGDQANEILDILGELGQGPKAQASEPEPVAEPEIIQEPIPTPLAEPVASKPITEPETKKAHKEYRPWLTAGITMIVFCLMLLGGYLFLQHKITQWAAELQNKSDEVGYLEEIEPLDEALEEELIVEQTNEEESPDLSREYTEFIATEKMHQDSRLAWMAYRYYGNKDFWVFIYEANRDHIANPNHIEVGTTIRVPRLDPRWSDTSKPEVQALIRELQETYLQP